MFSFIVCSINRDYLNGMKKSLENTCGLPYELLVWDNLSRNKPITEVYNVLGNRAQYPFLCFLHEDIVFKTDNWGVSLLKTFESDPGIGLIGVAGAKYKSRTPSGWSTGYRDWDCMNILHQNKKGITETLKVHPGNGDTEPVVNVDGVFMCVRKEVWNRIKFDDVLLKGFHLYDIDFSFRITQIYRALVVFNIDILHLTEGGNFGDEWVDYTLRWHRQYSEKLPAVSVDTVVSQAREKKIRRNWLHRLTTENISLKNKLRWVKETGALGDPLAWPYIAQFLAGRKFRSKKS